MEDLRIQKTIRKLKNAYETLVLQGDPNDIDVKSLCSFASINRTTFYNHFSCFEEFVESVIVGHMDAILLPKNYKSINSYDIEAYKGRTLDFIRSVSSNRLLVKLATCKDNSLYREIISKHQYELLTQCYPCDENTSYCIYAFSNSVCAIISKWLSSHKDVDEEIIANLIAENLIHLKKQLITYQK